MYAVDPHDSLVPIFVEHLSSGKIEQIGTGIFIEFQGAPFLLTAAHVTDITEYGSLMAPTRNGYPASKARQKCDVFSSEFASYRGLSARSEIYDELSLNSDSSIIIHFRKKNAVSPLNGKKMNPLSPRGVSGGGIFAWPAGHEFSNDWSLTRLVGIFHTYKERKGLMIGTNLISVFTAVQLGAMKNYGGVE